jgi:hypothetical protein
MTPMFAKQKLLLIVAAVLLPVGCRSTDCTAVYAHSPWEDADSAKHYFGGYTNVLAVCVYESRGEDRGPNRLGILHFKGTVVGSYKGDWKFAERISFVHYVDDRPRTTNAAAGYVYFVFCNDHTSHDIILETGDFVAYDPEIERVLQCVFPRSGH